MLPKHLVELTWYAPHQAWLQKNGYYTAHVVPDDIEPSRANLTRANLDGANLYGANLYGAKELPLDAVSFRQIVPESGSFTAFKKVYAHGDLFIAELIVPSDAKRIGGLTERKCRVSAARVIDVKTIAGDATDVKEFYSAHDSLFKYRVGDLVEPMQPFCDDPKIVCASGIHCFITRAEAVQY